MKPKSQENGREGKIKKKNEVSFNKLFTNLVLSCILENQSIIILL